MLDCVAGGAPVGFMHPLSRERALSFWRGVAVGVETRERALLVAEDAASTVAGTSAYGRLYEREGWQRCGVIPGYALLPQGGLCATTFYFKPIPA